MDKNTNVMERALSLGAQVGGALGADIPSREDIKRFANAPHVSIHTKGLKPVRLRMLGIGKGYGFEITHADAELPDGTAVRVDFPAHTVGDRWRTCLVNVGKENNFFAKPWIEVASILY